MTFLGIAARGRAAATPDPAPQQVGIGPVPVLTPRPTIARLREAMTALHVHGIARAVAFELLSYWQPGGAVFPSMRALAAGAGIAPRSVRRHLAYLERIGLWVRVGRTGRTNRYGLRLPGVQTRTEKARPRTPVSSPPGHLCPPEVTIEGYVPPAAADVHPDQQQGIPFELPQQQQRDDGPLRGWIWHTARTHGIELDDQDGQPLTEAVMNGLTYDALQDLADQVKVQMRQTGTGGR